MGYYLGIDESNHGNFPEVFVCVFSQDPKDILKYQKLPKVRNINNIRQEIDSRNPRYRHIVIPQVHQDILGGNYFVKMMVFSAFIEHFRDSGVELEQILIDGEVNDGLLDKVRALSNLPPSSKIIGEADGDKKYKVVNQADHLAYLLFCYYCQNPGRERKNAYIDTLLIPDIATYEKKIGELR